jgi:hypothetical protein
VGFDDKQDQEKKIVGLREARKKIMEQDARAAIEHNHDKLSNKV